MTQSCGPGNHTEGTPRDEGGLRVVRCTVCGELLSSGMIPQPGDPDSDE